jgi:hypothetical protein
MNKQGISHHVSYQPRLRRRRFDCSVSRLHGRRNPSRLAHTGDLTRTSAAVTNIKDTRPMFRNDTLTGKIAAAVTSVVLSVFFLATAIAPAIPAAGGGTLV